MLQDNTRIGERGSKRVKGTMKNIIRLTLEDLRQMVTDRVTSILNENQQIRQVLVEYYAMPRGEFVERIAKYTPILMAHVCLVQYGYWNNITEPMKHWFQEIENFFTQMTPLNVYGMGGEEGRRQAVEEGLGKCRFDCSTADGLYACVLPKFKKELGDKIQLDNLQYVYQYIAEDIFPSLMECIAECNHDAFMQIMYAEFKERP